MRVLIFALLVMTACSNSPRRDSQGDVLVGKWMAAGDQGGGHTWVLNYELRPDGSFRMSGYPPIEVNGRWQVKGSKPGKIHLVLTQQKMKAPGQSDSSWPDEDSWGELSADGRTLTYGGKTFTRQ